jgi:hypothetical protein
MLLQLGLLTLLTAPVWAQQPALPGAPQPSTMPSPSGNTPAPTPLPTPLANPRQEIIGQMYSVELRSGTNFLGTLQAATAQDLTFTTKDLGTVTVLRTNLRQLTLLTPKQASLGFDNVGNGTRLFFAPTARNLRKGEGYVQDIDIVLLGINYGITDNFSIGALVPIVPGLGLNVFALTPKLSIPVNDKLAFGVGTLFAVVDGSTGGIAYGVATYGSADNNVTAHRRNIHRRWGGRRFTGGAGRGFTRQWQPRLPICQRLRSDISGLPRLCVSLRQGQVITLLKAICL